jgi:hypothetical protein
MVKANFRILILLTAMSMGLAACGGSDGFSESNTPASPPPTTPPTTSPPPTPNVAPTISGAPVTSITAGEAYSFQPSAFDADGDTLTFGASGLPAWATISSQSGLVSGMPSDSDVGTTAGITVIVTDGTATVSLAPFQITIVAAAPLIPAPPPPPVNTAPSIAGVPATSVQATMSYSFAPSASDPEGQALVYSISNKPSWASFNASTGRLSGTPSAAQVGTYSSIVIAVSDGALSASLPAFSITVTAAPNSPPTISGSPATTGQATKAYTFTPNASDADGDTLTFSISGKPSWASFSASTGRLSGTPSASQVNNYGNIVISVSDGKVSASLPAFSINVTAAPNTAPTISGTAGTSVVAGNSYSFTPTANDADGDMLAFSISGKPAWATFNTATGKLSGTPTSSQVGSYMNIVISVSDGTASAALPAFAITVSPAPNSGTATLSWSAPTQNTDGSALTDLAGFRVYHGTSPDALDEMTQLPGASATTYAFDQLSAGTHYFAVAAYTASGVESALSTVGSKTIL